MVRITYEEIVCPLCLGEGCVEGEDCPDEPGLCECLPCPECHGAGRLRHAVIEMAERLPVAA